MEHYFNFTILRNYFVYADAPFCRQQHEAKVPLGKVSALEGLHLPLLRAAQAQNISNR